jgi:hypothetical protein
MLKKQITYTNFNDEQVTETHFFHLSKADIIEMQVSEKGGLDVVLQRAIDSGDNSRVLTVFKDLIRKAYGRKTDDGRFLKDKDATEEFLSGEAYSEILMQMMTDPGFAIEFANGIVPKDLEATANRINAAAASAKAATPESAETPALEKAGAALGSNVDPTGLTTPTTPQVLTQQQMLDMDSDELKSGLATGRYRLAP